MYVSIQPIFKQLLIGQFPSHIAGSLMLWQTFACLSPAYHRGFAVLQLHFTKKESRWTPILHRLQYMPFKSMVTFQQCLLIVSFIWETSHLPLCSNLFYTELFRKVNKHQEVHLRPRHSHGAWSAIAVLSTQYHRTREYFLFCVSVH